MARNFLSNLHILLIVEFTLKQIFEDENNIGTFWLRVKDDFTSLTKKGMEILLSFVTSHLCENDISAVTVVKTKYPSRLVIEKELTMKIVISLMTQRFRKFVLKKNRANKLLFQKEYILYFFLFSKICFY